MTPLDLHPSDRPAVIEAATGATATFAELLDRGAELLRPLDGQRRLLLLLCRNDTFTAAVYARALVAGHPVVMLDAQGAPEAHAGIAATYRGGWVAGPIGTGGRLAAAGAPVAAVAHSLDGELVRLDLGPAPTLHPDLGVLLTTSGTTGGRKLVRLSAANVDTNARAIAEYLTLTPDERPLAALPFHYSFGLSVLNSHWAAGAPVVVTTGSVVQRELWDAVRERACTSLAGVPYTYQMLERVGFRGMDLPSLHTLQQAGGALDRGLTQAYAEHMAARGGRFYVMYGQTEAAPRIAYVPPERLLEKLGSAGIPVPGGRLRIESAGPPDDAGRCVGEVVYEGPNVMLGYAAQAADLARGDQLGGSLRTGDVGYLDPDGFLFLVGRSKRIAKVFGLRVNLDEVEIRLREHGPAAVVGGTDEVHGFCAFGTDESLQELGRALAREYRLHHSAVRLHRVDQVPTTGSGKTDYEQVRRWTTG